MRVVLFFSCLVPAAALAGEAHFVSADEVAIISTADTDVSWDAARGPEWKREVVRVLGDGVDAVSVHPDGRSVLVQAGESSTITFTQARIETSYWYVERDRLEAIALPVVSRFDFTRPASNGRWLIETETALYARGADGQWDAIADLDRDPYDKQLFMEPMGTIVELRQNAKTVFFNARELTTDGSWTTTDLSPPVPAESATTPLAFGRPAKDGDRLVWFASAGNANAVQMSANATCKRVIVRMRHRDGGQWELDGDEVEAACQDEAPVAIDADRFLYQGALYEVHADGWQKIEQVLKPGYSVLDVWPDPLQLLVTEVGTRFGGFGTPERTYSLELMALGENGWSTHDLGAYAWSPRISEWCSQASPSTFAPLWLLLGVSFVSRCVRRRRRA